MDFPGWDGFLGTRASFMMDLVTLGMIFVVAVMWWSIRQARVHRRYQLHRRVQLALVALLLVVLTAFEVDVRLHGWQQRSADDLAGGASRAVLMVLAVHLFFAVSTVLLWLIVVVLALRRYSNPPMPNQHSPFHRRWGQLAAWDMTMTTITGWIFYVMAFAL